VLFPDKTAADNLVIMAPPVDSKLVEPILVSGRWLQAGDEKASPSARVFWKNSLTSSRTIPAHEGGCKEDDWEVVGIFKFVSQQERLPTEHTIIFPDLSIWPIARSPSGLWRTA